MTTDPLPPLLHGRAALVAGGAGGIGSATARLMTAAGARVMCADRPGAEPPEGCLFHACDIRNGEEVAALMGRVEHELGRLDVLVHSAGITRDGPLWRLTDEDWQDVLETNLGSAFSLVRAAVPLMRGAGGAVALVSSINGQRGKAGQANYAASKAGVDALAKTAALELGRFGIRVNAVAPGWIETRMTAGLPDALRDRALRETALGRVGQPDDVARAILFLCCDWSRHITGQVLRVDGGQLTA
jgi:acetoacetyl-CoA reductase/3-oxoacyl-[acyl-carrier protein] reductase